MKNIKVQELSVEKFARYGSYARLVNPDSDATGPKDAAIVFYRDMVKQELFGENPAFSTLMVKPRPNVIEFGEYHDNTCEVGMPLDGDIIAWFAPADCSEKVPVDKMEAFRIPQGTVFMIRPGVWHHAPFCVGSKPVSIMIVLPERCYCKDCKCIPIPKAEQRKVTK
ncbi:MAG: hypothetical protein MJ025_04760 [Victivallaceae bacterium]|nr:hypothetical protein [Victivallaceae bacterium]